MRALAILLCLVPTVANAEEVRAVFGRTLTRGAVFDDPVDPILRVRLHGMDEALEQRWTIPGLTPADVGNVWTVDASTAASQLVDWEWIEDRVKDPYQFPYYDLQIHSVFTGKPHYRWPNVVFDQLDRIEFHLLAFDTTKDNYNVSWRHVLIGHGSYPIPEPSTMLLAAVSGCWIMATRRRR